MIHDDHIYLAKYARDHNLLNNPGWKQICRYVKNTKNTNSLLKYAKDKQHHNTVNIKLGMMISCDHKEAMILDADNGKNNWKDAELLKLN